MRFWESGGGGESGEAGEFGGVRGQVCRGPDHGPDHITLCEIGRLALALWAKCAQNEFVGEPVKPSPALRIAPRSDTADVCAPVPPERDPLRVVGLYTAERAGEGLTAQHLREVHGLVRDLYEHAGSTDIADMDRDRVVRFLAMCQKQGRAHRLADGTITKRRKPAGAKTRKDHTLALRAFFRWCQETGRGLGSNPTDGIAIPKTHRTQQRAFTIAEVGALLNHAPPEYAVLYWVLMVTGLRIGSAIQLPVGCFYIDVEPFKVVVPVEVCRKARPYTAAIPPNVALMLRWYRERHGLAADSKGTFLQFPKIKRIRTKLRQHLVKHCKKAGVLAVDQQGRRAGLHCFRRAMVTSILDMGFDPKIAQMQAGHEKVETTLTFYNDRDLPDQALAAQALADAVEASQHPGRIQVAQKNVDRVASMDDTSHAKRPMKHPNSITSKRVLAANAGRFAAPAGGSPLARDGSTSPALSGQASEKWAIQGSNL